MNIGQCIGQLQLRIAELEEGGGRTRASKVELPAMIEAELRKARAEVDEAKRIKLQTHLQLVEERRAREAAEHSLAALKREHAQRDMSDSPLFASMKQTIAGLEAKLRGRDQALSEAQRKLDAAEQRIRGLESAKLAPPAPPAAECPVCRAIKLMVLGVPMPAEGGTQKRQHANQHAAGAARGICANIREALASADRPMTCGEIATAAGVTASKIATNIGHLHLRREVVRVGMAAVGIRGGGYRYWLASRPLPQGEQA